MRTPEQVKQKLDEAKGELKSINDRIAKLGEEVREKRKNEALGSKAYSQSARNADIQELEGLKFQGEEIRENILILGEAVEEATVAATRAEVQSIEDEMRSLKKDAADRYPDLQESFESYLEADLSIREKHNAWSKLQGRRCNLLRDLGDPSMPGAGNPAAPEEIDFNLRPTPFQGFQSSNNPALRDKRFTHFQPGWKPRKEEAMAS